MSFWKSWSASPCRVPRGDFRRWIWVNLNGCFYCILIQAAGTAFNLLVYFSPFGGWPNLSAAAVAFVFMFFCAAMWRSVRRARLSIIESHERHRELMSIYRPGGRQDDDAF